MGRFSLQNKVALITGGSRGLGLIIAQKLCRAGAKVALIARDADELARAESDLAGRGGEVLTISCDLLERPQIEAAVQETINRFGTINILINNAGIIQVGPLEHMVREDFERAMRLHFWAPFDLIRQVVPEMRHRGGGRIVNISSIGGKIAVPHMAPYTASKFALAGLSDALCGELARENILVTTVTPGMMRTGSQGHANFKGDHAREYKWFAASSALPLASISAEHAARKIIAACVRGKPALIMPIPARALILANVLCPNLFGHVMRIVNRYLPLAVGPSGDDSRAGVDFQ
ncbi:MAG TPA: SDR family oxidoreductase [Chthoniobacterales bacterium]|nr:SDR family oxidoreductase [Chthoniobacterales bacterium]